MRHVLIIEDDEALARGLRDNLTFEGLDVRTTGSAEQGLEELRRGQVDLLLLDLMLPGLSGFDVLRRMRELPHPPRTIVVSARDAEADIVRALDLGAHDYVRKPFGLAELLARVRAQLRELEDHKAGEVAALEELTFADVRVSFRRFRLWKGDAEHLLSHTEVKVLELLARHPDQPLRRSEMLSFAWGDDVYPTERTVDNFILKLRKKIEDDPAQPRYLRTVHGVGYRFCPQG
ncbi:MAG: response regulator transcription factor [Planctomycetota bacterium]